MKYKAVYRNGALILPHKQINPGDLIRVGDSTRKDILMYLGPANMSYSGQPIKTKPNVEFETSDDYHLPLTHPYECFDGEEITVPYTQIYYVEKLHGE